jgi:hypothetical protein
MKYPTLDRPKDHITDIIKRIYKADMITTSGEKYPVKNYSK